jgi:hypothetical protein
MRHTLPVNSRCDPNGIRTRVTAVKGRCPGPLDDRVVGAGNIDFNSSRASDLAESLFPRFLQLTRWVLRAVLERLAAAREAC